jgi:hypothetical protein
LNTNRNRGLRTGNKAATAIIVMLGVAAIAGIVFLIMRRHRSTRLLKEQFESVQNQSPKTQYTQVQQAIPQSNCSPAESLSLQRRIYMGFTMEALRYQWRNYQEDRDDGYGFSFWNDIMQKTSCFT